MRVFKNRGLVLAMLALGGCTILPESREVSLYQLPEPSLAAAGPVTSPWTLRLRTPRTSEALSGTRLLVMTDDNELAAYSGVRWVSTTPRLWLDHLARATVADGRLSAVTTDRDNLLADRELSGMLRDFHVDFRGAVPEAVVRYDAVLAGSASRRIIASRSFSAREPLHGKDAAAMVAALGAASDRVSSDLLNWMLSAESNP